MKPVLGIFLNFGDSFSEYQKSGRDSHWLNNYLRFYPKYFKRVYVFSYADEANPYPSLIKLLPNRYHLPRWLYAWLMPWFYRQEVRQCRVLRVKQMLGVWPALVAKFLWRIPVVATYGYDYAHFAQKEGKWWLVPLIKLTEWFGWLFASKVIVTMPSDRKKTVLIPNGVDVDLFKPVRKTIKKPIKILTVGRLVYQKNQQNLIRAIARLAVPAELILVGRGPLKQRIFALAKKLKVRLKYIESAGHLELAGIYQGADIFCLPSRHEGSPKALLEAMSCGLACIVSDKPFSRFIITNNQDGILTENNVGKLSLSMNRLIDSLELRRRLGLAARETIRKQFNNQKIIQEELKLLTSFLPSSSA